MRVAASLLLVFFAFACRQSGSPSLPPEPSGPAVQLRDVLRAEGVNGRLRFELELVPPAPQPGDLFEVVTSVYDARTGEQRAVAVAVDATMPHHGHGMATKPVHEPLEDGRVRTRGMKLHMPGRWLLTVTGEEDRAEWVVELPHRRSAAEPGE